MREPAEMKIDKKLTIINERGLHARAAAKFTETIAPFSCTINVSKDNETVSGHSRSKSCMIFYGVVE